MDPGGRTGCENIVLQLSIKFIKNDGELPFSMLFIDLQPTMIDRKLGTLFETLFRTNLFKNIERDTIYENRVSQSQVTSKLY